MGVAVPAGTIVFVPPKPNAYITTVSPGWPRVDESTNGDELTSEPSACVITFWQGNGESGDAPKKAASQTVSRCGFIGSSSSGKVGPAAPFCEMVKAVVVPSIGPPGF